MKINYLEELNESQREAVIYNEGPALVIAGAGSGKTRVLTYKIAYLLENGYAPWNILALTFTNKAAREMKERIAPIAGEQRARYLWMGTFHSVFSRILRAEADSLGFPRHFTIYDSADSKSLLRSIIKEMELNDKVYKPSYIQTRISNAKSHLISAEAYAMDAETTDYDTKTGVPLLPDIYKKYRDRCRQAGAMDFDDLLFYTYILFRDFPDILKKYREQFQYVLVDEYQDTNFAQHAIVLQLCEAKQRICVVGDDAQSIYSFRGADIDNILNFAETFPDTRLFKLERNYRSTQTIVSAANSLIRKNLEQIPKEVYSEKEKGEAITAFQAYSDAEEAEITVNKIRELCRTEDCEYADFAILYRTNAQSRVFEEAFRRRGIPYKIYGGLSFYQRKEIKDAIAYFRLVINPDDEEALKRVINYPARGIGQTTLGKIINSAAQNQASLWTVMSDPEYFDLNITKGTKKKLDEFRKMLQEDFMEQMSQKNAYEIGKDIIRKSGIMSEINSDESPESLSRKENIDELLNGMHAFCEQRMEEGDENVYLIDFLSEVSLLTDQDSDKEGDEKKVTLMTIHSAKGLEFPVVFIVGIEEEIFPSSRANSPKAIEEERRLFYVAITRAEKACFLSFAKNRFRYGSSEVCSPSRFLKDIDPAYLDWPREKGHERRVDEGSKRFHTEMKKTESRRPQEREMPPTPRNLKRVSPAASAGSEPGNVAHLQVGQIIEHERFGIGEVANIEGKGDNAKATIRFEDAGSKQLLLRFARFKVLK